MKKRMSFSVLAVLLFFASFSFSSNVKAAERKVSNNPSQEQILEMAAELEYIFTEIIIENDKTGKYFVNEEELKNSSYNQEEKEAIKFFAEYLNQEKNGISNLSKKSDVSTMSAKSTVKKCLQEALGIGNDIINEFMGYVEKKQWIAAAGILAVAGIAVQPVTVFIFAMTCGAGSAS